MTKRSRPDLWGARRSNPPLLPGTGPKVRGHFCLNQVGVSNSGMWAG